MGAGGGRAIFFWGGGNWLPAVFLVLNIKIIHAFRLKLRKLSSKKGWYQLPNRGRGMSNVIEIDEQDWISKTEFQSWSQFRSSARLQWSRITILLLLYSMIIHKPLCWCGSIFISELISRIAFEAVNDFDFYDKMKLRHYIIPHAFIFSKFFRVSRNIFLGILTWMSRGRNRNWRFKFDFSIKSLSVIVT